MKKPLALNEMTVYYDAIPDYEEGWHDPCRRGQLLRRKR